MSCFLYFFGNFYVFCSGAVEVVCSEEEASGEPLMSAFFRILKKECFFRGVVAGPWSSMNKAGWKVTF